MEDGERTGGTPPTLPPPHSTLPPLNLQISWNVEWKTTGGQTVAGLLSPQQELRGADGSRRGKRLGQQSPPPPLHELFKALWRQKSTQRN